MAKVAQKMPIEVIYFVKIRLQFEHYQTILVALALAEKFPTANFPSHNLFENSLIGSILFYSILPPSFLHI